MLRVAITVRSQQGAGGTQHELAVPARVGDLVERARAQEVEILPIMPLPDCSVNHRFPSGPGEIWFGSTPNRKNSYVVIVPVGVICPMFSSEPSKYWSVNQRLPSLPAAIP